MLAAMVVPAFSKARRSSLDTAVLTTARQLAVVANARYKQNQHLMLLG